MKIKWERRRKKKIRNSRENGRDETRKKKARQKKIERGGWTTIVTAEKRVILDPILRPRCPSCIKDARASF